MPVHVRVCRDCGEEYRPEAVRCADCGGELEDRQLDEEGELVGTARAEAGGAKEEPQPAEPVVHHRVMFMTPRAAELVPLADALREAEIEYRLAEQPATSEAVSTRFALLVAEQDAPAALRVLAPLLGSVEEVDDSVEAGFEPGRGYVQCPACGAESAPGSLECSECGLGLGSAEEATAACARCGAPLAGPNEICPACGGSPIG